MIIKKANIYKDQEERTKVCFAWYPTQVNPPNGAWIWLEKYVEIQRYYMGIKEWCSIVVSRKSYNDALIDRLEN